MTLLRNLIVLCILWMASLPAIADSLVLIHGYISSGETWHRSGVSQVLARNGWPFGGHFAANGFHPSPVANGSTQRFYTVDLPYERPIDIQAAILGKYISQIAQMHPGEKIILAGHSAGGVVARMAVVRGLAPNVSALITIASPHIGTPLAARGLRATNDSGPVSFVKGFFGGKTYHTVRRSRRLLVDLLPPSRRNLLGWLNLQPHPDIQYFSVVRSRGDGIVPAFSEDMNQIPVLAGRSQLILSYAGHSLNPEDGMIILDILQRLETSTPLNTALNATNNPAKTR